MRDFPSCFGESGVQISDSSSSSKSNQNIITCLYHAHVRNLLHPVTVTWARHLVGPTLTITVDDAKLDIKPWLFTKTKGSKLLEAADDTKVEIFWDLSAAKFSVGPEPTDGFYVAIVADVTMILLLGDMITEAYIKTNVPPSISNAILVSKKEHLFGKRVHSTKSQICGNGKVHDVAIECANVESLEIRVDKKRVLYVKRLGWKFRGNSTILVDGSSVEVFWDVHGWLFGGGHFGNSAVFMFQSGSEKERELKGAGFSLVLYAQKNE